MKKRLLYIVLGMLLVLGLLTGCKKKSSEAPTKAETTAQITTQATTQTEAPTKAETVAPDKESTTAEKTTEAQTEAKTEAPTEATTEVQTEAPTEAGIDEDGSYNTKDEVALYIHTYGHLPSNYVTKKEAQNMGWDSGDKNKSLDKVAPGYSIGGDKFGNYEELLPKAKGRQYYECDIDYKKGSRNAKRIIFSNDGLIYYTEDHYESFVQLY